MTWQEEMMPMLRSIIDDTDVTALTYSDDRLEEILVIAATYVEMRVSTGVYTMSVAQVTMTPDPVDRRDNGFVNLTVMKAACIIGRGEWKARAKQSIVVKDDVSMIDTRNASGDTRAWAEDMCKEYDKAELDYRLGNSKAGQAIVGPHCTDNMLNTQSPSGHRGRQDYFN